MLGSYLLCSASAADLEIPERVCSGCTGDLELSGGPCGASASDRELSDRLRSGSEAGGKKPGGACGGSAGHREVSGGPCRGSASVLETPDRLCSGCMNDRELSGRAWRGSPSASRCVQFLHGTDSESSGGGERSSLLGCQSQQLSYNPAMRKPADPALDEISAR